MADVVVWGEGEAEVRRIKLKREPGIIQDGSQFRNKTLVRLVCPSLLTGLK